MRTKKTALPNADRLTLNQRRVLRHMLEHPESTLEDAAAEIGMGFSWVRKWLADKEFHDYLSDIRSWRRLMVRERLAQAMHLASHECRKAVPLAVAADQRRLLAQADRLTALADQLLDLEQQERVKPISSLGWRERTGAGNRPVNPISAPALTPEKVAELIAREKKAKATAEQSGL